MCSTLNLTCSFSTGASHLMALLTRSLVFLLFVILYAVFLSVSITFLLLFSPQLELYSLFFTLSSNIIHIIQYIPGSFQSFQHQAVSHQSLRITSTVSMQFRTKKYHTVSCKTTQFDNAYHGPMDTLLSPHLCPHLLTQFWIMLGFVVLHSGTLDSICNFCNAFLC